MRNLVRSTLVALILAAVCAVLGFAQSQSNTPYPVPQYYASAFGQWSIQLDNPNTYIFQGRTRCNSMANNVPFFTFATNAPVWIQDSNTANSEVKTPSAVVLTAGTCGVTIAPSNNHYTAWLRSGTGGLQEAINGSLGAATSAYPAEIILDRNWYAQASTTPGTTAAGIIAAAVGNASVYLLDITTVPNQYYSWNGTAFTPSATNLTAPTVAAGTGAGTGPTIAVVAGSTGTAGSVTLTTGTAPAASGIIFTLTWPSIALGGFQYAPVCTISSVGTRLYATGVTTTTAGPPATAVLTASTVALTASVSGYKFSYSCH